MNDVFTQVKDILVHIVSNLTHPETWTAVLADPRVALAACIAVTLIVFTETGLLVGFFLPGDSLLVTAGVAAKLGGWPIEYLIPSLWCAAILGDSCGYLIGRTVGPRVFQKEKSFFFRKKYLLAAQAFYEKHGGKTIILAKFVPIIRTFAPVVAGAGSMKYRRFLAYSVVGGILWTTSMLLLGYTLDVWLDPLLKPVFGPDFQVAKHIDKVIIVVVGVSILPIVWKAWKGYRGRQETSTIVQVAPDKLDKRNVT